MRKLHVLGAMLLAAALPAAAQSKARENAMRAKNPRVEMVLR